MTVSQTPGTMGAVSVGEELLEARRRRRRHGDPRLSDKAREVLLRMTTGDLVDEFQDALDANLDDPHSATTQILTTMTTTSASRVLAFSGCWS